MVCLITPPALDAQESQDPRGSSRHFDRDHDDTSSVLLVPAGAASDATGSQSGSQFRARRGTGGSIYGMVGTARGEVEGCEVFTRLWVVEAIIDLDAWCGNRDPALTSLEPSVRLGKFLGRVWEALLHIVVPYPSFDRFEYAVRGRLRHIQVPARTAHIPCLEAQ